MPTANHHQFNVICLLYRLLLLLHFFFFQIGILVFNLFFGGLSNFFFCDGHSREIGGALFSQQHLCTPHSAHFPILWIVTLTGLFFFKEHDMEYSELMFKYIQLTINQ